MNEKTVNVNDVFYFETSWNKKSDKESFIGYDDYGKIIISDKLFPRGGFFKIAKVKKITTNYTIVTLGERVDANDLYPDINLEEAKSILKKFGFETYEKEFNFNAYDEERHEIQLFAWHKKYNIFINGTTWTCDGCDKGHFNNLDIYAPNYLRTFNSISHGQFATSSEEITIGLHSIHNDEKVLTKLMRLAEEAPNKKIVMKFIKDGKSHFCNLDSYVCEHIGYKNTLNGWEEYAKDIYKELPRSLKEFIIYNTKTVA